MTSIACASLTQFCRHTKRWMQGDVGISHSMRRLICLLTAFFDWFSFICFPHFIHSSQLPMQSVSKNNTRAEGTQETKCINITKESCLWMMTQKICPPITSKQKQPRMEAIWMHEDGTLPLHSDGNELAVSAAVLSNHHLLLDTKKQPAQSHHFDAQCNSNKSFLCCPRCERKCKWPEQVNFCTRSAQGISVH